MYDLHTHTVFSDGVLVPAESARRAKIIGYKGMAFTDHADDSNYSFIIEKLLLFKEQFNSDSEDFKVIAGVELTHVIPSRIGRLTELCREAGADIILVHGETIVEPVESGTNRAAVEAGVDILAHPGLIDEDSVRIGVENGVSFELTTRKGHGYTNGHVAGLVLKNGGNLVVNNDFHAPGDMPSVEMIKKILLGIGLEIAAAEQIIENNKKLFIKVLED